MSEAIASPAPPAQVRRSSWAFGWFAFSVTLSFLSALLGTSLSFVGLQFAIFLCAGVACRVLFPVAPVVALVSLASLGKNFLISQVVKLLVLQPADTHLSSPLRTEWAILCGIIGVLVAGLCWRMFIPKMTFAGVITPPNDSRYLLVFGHVLAFFGISGDMGAMLFRAQSVIFHYLSFLVYGAVISYVIYILSQKKRQIINIGILTLLMIHLLLNVRSGDRASIMLPFAFIGLIYILFRRRPSTLFLLSALSLVIIIYEVISPTIDFARLTGNKGPNVQTEFVSDLADLVKDPGRLAVYRKVDSEYGESLRAHQRLYYGTSLGLLDRFSPCQVDNLVSASALERLDMSEYVGGALRALIPQSLGFKRNAAVGQRELESLSTHEVSTGENWANYGLSGTFYAVYGGAGDVMGYLLFVTAMIAISQFLFGPRGQLWSLSLLPIWLFVMADQNLAGALIIIVHGTIIFGGAFWMLNAVTLGAMRSGSTRLSAVE